jgi:hypothetical protein
MSEKNSVKAVEVEIGIHPDGFKIDKTASAINRYTKWTIAEDGTWTEPKPVCFHSLPEDGWETVDKIDWD